LLHLRRLHHRGLLLQLYLLLVEHRRLNVERVLILLCVGLFRRHSSVHRRGRRFGARLRSQLVRCDSFLMLMSLTFLSSLRHHL
jgi:hypothetical protein